MCFSTAFEVEGWRRIPIVLSIFESFNIETENLHLTFDRVTHPYSIDRTLPNFRPSSISFDDVLDQSQCCVVQVAYHFQQNGTPKVGCSAFTHFLGHKFGCIKLMPIKWIF